MSCGAANPKKTTDLCILAEGHKGMHFAGKGFHWKGEAWKSGAPPKKPAPATKAKKQAPSTPEPTVSADAAAKLGIAGYCGAKFESYTTSSVCTLAAGHAGLHENASAGLRQFEDEEGDAAAIAAHDADAIARAELEPEDDEAENIPGGPAPIPMALTAVAVLRYRRLRSKYSGGEYEVHPAAAVLPMIAESEWPGFLDDIRANGQRRKIVLIDVGSSRQILDGRNRLRACLELGREPQFRMFGDDPGDGSDPIRFVASENVRGRRHLDKSQCAAIAAELANLSQGQRKTGPGAGVVGITQAEAAAMSGASERSVRRANSVHDKAVPELWTAVKQGKVDLKGAEQVAKLPPKKQREIVKERIDTSKGPVRGGKLAAIAKQEEKRAVVRKINEQLVAPLPSGAFGVIYADYPWLYENSDQHDGSRGHLPYPPMTMDQILAHARDTATRAAKDCIVALWTTNLYITKMGAVVEAYGAEIRTVYTWPKPRAGVGTWGRGQTEHLVIASIGAPVHTLNEVSTLLQPFRPEHPDEHSSKPAEVAELLAKHCAGPHLELFARGPREGWVTWGAEADKFATEAA